MKQRLFWWVVCLFGMAAHAMAQEVTPGLKYQIMNSVELAMAKAADGHLVIATPNSEDPMQQWVFVTQEDGSYALYNEGAQEYVGLGTANAWDAQFFVSMPSEAVTAQYQLEDLDGEWMAIKLMSNGKYLGTDGVTDGSWVYLDKQPSANGYWKLVCLSEGPESEYKAMVQTIVAYAEENLANWPCLIEEVGDILMQYEEIYSDSGDYAAGIEALRTLQGRIAQACKNIVLIENELYAVDELLEETGYPGKADLHKVMTDAYAMLQSEDLTLTWLLETPANLQESVNDYYKSQIPVATKENPADLTMWVKAPSFRVEKTYTAESTPSNEGWNLVCLPNDANDVGARHKYDWETGKNLTCYNGWNTSFKTMELSQQLSGLPEGRYRVECMAFTWSGLRTDQHVFARTTSGLEVTSGIPSEAIESFEWETQITDEVAVYDGELTIGFASSNPIGSGAQGSFLVTDFRLLYTGGIVADDLKDVLANLVAEGDTLTAPLGGDQQKLTEALAEARKASDVESMKQAIFDLGNAVSRSKASTDAYTEFMDNVLTPIKENTDYAKSEDMKAVMEKTVKYVEQRLGSSDILYEELDDLTLLLNAYSAYADSYVKDVMAIMAEAGEYNADAVAYLQGLVVEQWNRMGETLDSEIAKAELDKLGRVVENVRLGRKAGENADMSFRIQNGTVTDGHEWWTPYWYTDHNCGQQTRTGDHYSGDIQNRYLDGRGYEENMKFTAYNIVENLPNGIYRLKAACRADAADAYLYAVNTDGTMWKTAIPIYSDQLGEIYNEALDKALTEAAERLGKTKQEVYDDDLYECNVPDKGWSWVTVEGIEVKEHQLTIGISCDMNVTGAEEAYKGFLISGDDFQLTYLIAGDNTDFEYVTPIESVKVAQSSGRTGIYDLQGRRMAEGSVLSRGIYVVNGRKVWIK